MRYISVRKSSIPYVSAAEACSESLVWQLSGGHSVVHVICPYQLVVLPLHSEHTVNALRACREDVPCSASDC
nr:hypothetical protein CFP56_24511 [Quercus suber]